MSDLERLEAVEAHCKKTDERIIDLQLSVLSNANHSIDVNEYIIHLQTVVCDIQQSVMSLQRIVESLKKKE